MQTTIYQPSILPVLPVAWEQTKWYQARIRCTIDWIRIIAYDPIKDCYLCRSGATKEVFGADELADFCD